MNSIQVRMSAIFNEWADRYSEDPESFDNLLDEDGKPIEDYGKRCSAYFMQIAHDLDEKGPLPKHD